MTVDTKILHVTKPGANLFLELGFAPDEARRLQAASRKYINDTRSEAAANGRVVGLDCGTSLKQADTAEILMVSGPRVSDVVNKKTAKFYAVYTMCYNVHTNGD